MKFEVENNINEVVRKILTKMKIERVNSKNLKKNLRREPKKNSKKRPVRQRAAMFSNLGNMKHKVSLRDSVKDKKITERLENNSIS